MDAFYASVEQRDHPELRGRPVIVGGSRGQRGVVSAASYEARAYGVRSAMPTATATRLCPQGVFLPVRMRRYAQVAKQIREIFFEFTPLVEPLSLDEAFLDVRGCEGLFGPAPAIARQAKQRIWNETNLVASVGVAPNKFLANLEPHQVTAFLAPLPVGRLWGIGAKGEERLHRLGLRTVGQLAALSEAVLAAQFGEVGKHLWQLARGSDDRSVVPDRAAKSISTETTFAADVGDLDVLRIWLLDLVDHLATRLRRAAVRAGTLELKLRSSDFHTIHRAQALQEPTHQTDVLWRAAVQLFDRVLKTELLPLRLLGVGAGKLTQAETVQASLFEPQERRAALDRTVDGIRGRFGAGSIRRGSLLDPRVPQPEEPADE
jgi:DNA polymerase-4